MTNRRQTREHDELADAAQPACEHCGIVLRDAPSGWACPSCGLVVKHLLDTSMPTFVGPSIHGG
jgi:rubrerythrin